MTLHDPQKRLPMPRPNQAVQNDPFCGVSPRASRQTLISTG
jgi:hypothetical protein